VARRITYIVWQWLPVVLWLLVIAVESTDLMSARNTGSVIYIALAAIVGPIDPDRFTVFHAVLRKTGHFVGYGFLSFLFFCALRNTVTSNLARLWSLSVIFTCIVSSLDEWHQTFLPSRTGAFHDVVLDTFAALCVQTVIFVAVRRKQRSLAAAADLPLSAIAENEQQPSESR
jgi:VanZ family protein